MCATTLDLISKLEELIRLNRIGKAIAFLNQNGEQLKKSIPKNKSLPKNKKRDIQCIEDWVAQQIEDVVRHIESWVTLRSHEWDIEGELWPLWDMEDGQYRSYIQWLPKEMLVDTVAILHNSYSTPNHSYFWIKNYYEVNSSSFRQLYKLLLDYDIVDLTEEVDAFNSLRWVLQNNYRFMVRLLLENGVKVNALDKQGKSHLHFVVDNNNVSMARLLIEMGADVNAEDQNGRTPLDLAECYKYKEMMNLLQNPIPAAPMPRASSPSSSLYSMYGGSNSNHEEPRADEQAKSEKSLGL